MAELHNPTAFYAGARRVTGALSPAQADTIAALLTAAAAWPIGWLAYGLATAWGECRLTPQDEAGKGHGKPYGVPGKHGGQIPYGRGLVQLTWDTGYEWADNALGLDGALLKNFELANHPIIATRILVLGMASGHFTGKKLGDYITVRGTHGEFVQARRIINSEDRAGQFALFSDHFQDSLDLGGWR